MKKNDQILDIEHAIETVRLFKEHKEATTCSKLQKSVDLIKVYTTLYGDMQQGTDEQKLLADRILDAAKGYNEEVRKEKVRTASLSSIIKRFFLRMAGKAEHRLLAEAEIPIPAKFSTDKIKSVLQSVQKNSDHAFGTPKQEELDLFRTKVVSLLQDYKEVALSFDEAITLVRKSPISHLFEEKGSVQLSQKISPLPGVEIEATGLFQRDIHHRQLALPVKESFQLKSSIFQTGFCHPLQYVGLALHEKLIPSCILRPTLCPQFQQLLLKKADIANRLTPGNALYNKARGQIKQKMTFAAPIGLLEAHHTACQDELVYDDRDSFEPFSHKARAFAQNVFGTPISCLQEEWLINQNQAVVNDPRTECSKIYQDAALEGPLYNKKTSACFIEAGLAIHLLQLSEHLQFTPEPLSPFAKRLFISLVRQQLLFIYELEELMPNQLEAHFTKVIEQEKALFLAEGSDDSFTKEATLLVDELITYYNERGL